MTKIPNKHLDNFLILINDFLSKKIDGDTFERKYIYLYCHYRDKLENIFEEINLNSNDALGDIFISVDAFCSDPKLRDKNDIDESTLRKEVSKIAKRLESQ